MSLCTTLALTLHLFSWHSQPNYHNGNRGIGIACDSIHVGFYRNSFKRNTSYLAYHHETGDLLRVGMLVGVASGYDHGILHGGLTVGFNYGRVRCRLLFAPTGKGLHAAYHFLVQYDIGKLR